MNNIKKIQSMLKGGYRKIQVGAEPITIHQRAEGAKWTDVNGRKWIKENGQRKQITKMPAKGFNKCNDCKKLILKDRDQSTYNRMQRCFKCQINFEAELVGKNKWDAWAAEQFEKRMQIIEDEVKSIMKEMKDSSENNFDKTVAYAIGNEEQIKNREKIKRETA
tara:strand:- start:556 stop:1047 length:492 start_codon:yes stop_codon:yes gene_type:complete